MSVPFIVVSGGSTTATGPSLLTLRNRLADELGFYHPTTVTAATGGDPTRVVIAAELEDDEEGADLLARRWLYVRTGAQAGVQRRIVSQPGVGYQGGQSALIMSRAFAAALVSGSAVEVTSPLPVKRHLGVKGLNDCITEALGMLRLAVRITLTGTGTYQQDLSAYPWLTSVDQTRGIYDTVNLIGGSPPILSGYGYDFVSNGATRTLVTEWPYTTADTYYLDAVIRGDRLVYDGSAWVYLDPDDPPGLLDDTYRTAAPEHWVLTFGMVVALRQVQKMLLADGSLPRDEKQMLLADVAQRKRHWSWAARTIVLKEFPPPLQIRSTPLIVAPEPVAWI